MYLRKTVLVKIVTSLNKDNQKSNFFYMKILKTKIQIICTIMMIVGLGALASCSQEDDVVAKSDSSVSLNTNTYSSKTVSAPSGTFNVIYEIPLGNYSHVQQETGKCAVTSYVVARKIRNSSYPNAYSNINTIHNLLTPVSVYKLYNYQDETLKSYFGEPAGNAEWGPKRELLKTYIVNNLSLGRPVIIPTEYNLSSGAIGHFYIVVSLHWKNGGTGSVIGVKDVLSSSSSTKYFDYSAFLSSNWRNSHSLAGNRNYSAYAFN